MVEGLPTGPRTQGLRRKAALRGHGSARDPTNPSPYKLSHKTPVVGAVTAPA